MPGCHGWLGSFLNEFTLFLDSWFVGVEDEQGWGSWDADE